MGKSEKAAVVNSFYYSNFNYIQLVRHFRIFQLIRKIEKIQKHCLRIVFDDFENDNENLLRKSGHVTMEKNH